MIETEFQTRALDQAETIMWQNVQNAWVAWDPRTKLGATTIGAALVPFRPDSALKILPICLERYPRSAVPLAIALAEKFPDEARGVMDSLRKTDAFELVGSALISVALGDIEPARSVMAQLLDGGLPMDALRIAESLTRDDPESSLEAMRHATEERSPSNHPFLYSESVAPIAVALAPSYPTEATEVFDRTKQEFPGTAALVAIGLGRRDFAVRVVQKWISADQSIRPNQRRDIDEKVRAIAINLGDRELLKSCIARYFEEPRQIPEIYDLAAELAFLDPAEGQVIRTKLFQENLLSPNITIKPGILQVSAALGDLEFTGRLIKQMVTDNILIGASTALALIRLASD